MKQKARGIGVGTISLIMIFSVLCLTIFAMLTLSTSNAEKALADRTSYFVVSYYEADAYATRIKAQLLQSARVGLFPDAVDDVFITYEYEYGDIIAATYNIRMNDMQDLYVRLGLEEGKHVVSEWKTVFKADWEIDESLNVLDLDDFLAQFLD